MIKLKNIIGCFMLFILVTSCQSALPNFSMVENIAPVSTKRISRAEKKGTEKITRFAAYFNPVLRGELPSRLLTGIFTVISVDMRDSKLEIQNTAFAYLKKEYLYNPWCNPVFEVVDFKGAEDTAHCLYLITDASGTQYVMSPGPDGRFLSKETGYDFRKLEKNLAYRKRVFSEIGMTISEVIASWKALGWDCSQANEEIVIGSRRWNSFKKELRKSFPHKYRLLNGDEVLSALPKEEFKLKVAKNPENTWGQRFGKAFNLTFADPTTMGISAASQVVNFMIKEAAFGSGYASKITRKEAGVLIDIWVDYEQTCRQKRWEGGQE